MTREEKLAYTSTLTPEENQNSGNEVHKVLSRRAAEAMMESPHAKGRWLGK